MSSANDDYRVGAIVRLRGLSARADLNGHCGFVKGRVTAAKDSRWIVRLDGEDTTQGAVAAAPSAQIVVVKVRRKNLTIPDQILAQDDEGQPIFSQGQADWKDCDDWNKSAAAVYYKLARQAFGAAASAAAGPCCRPEDPTGLLKGLFRVAIIVHCDKRWHRFQPPPVVAARRPLEEENFWDRAELLAAIRDALTRDALVGAPPPSVEEAKIDWSAASTDGFVKSIMSVIERAHSDASVLHVALRTPENTDQFVLVQAFSGNAPASMNAALGVSCSTVLTPTECIIFHTDNMIKLPTSTMSVDQASRKVAQIVREGVDVPCPICLDQIASDDRPAVFLPCSCKGAVHSDCLYKLYETGCVACPLCREGIGLGAWDRALQ